MLSLSASIQHFLRQIGEGSKLREKYRIFELRSECTINNAEVIEQRLRLKAHRQLNTLERLHADNVGDTFPTRNLESNPRIGLVFDNCRI